MLVSALLGNRPRQLKDAEEPNAAPPSPSAQWQGSFAERGRKRSNKELKQLAIEGANVFESLQKEDEAEVLRSLDMEDGPLEEEVLTSGLLLSLIQHLRLSRLPGGCLRLSLGVGE